MSCNLLKKKPYHFSIFDYHLFKLKGMNKVFVLKKTMIIYLIYWQITFRLAMQHTRIQTLSNISISIHVRFKKCVATLWPQTLPGHFEPNQAKFDISYVDNMAITKKENTWHFLLQQKQVTFNSWITFLISRQDSLKTT